MYAILFSTKMSTQQELFATELQQNSFSRFRNFSQQVDASEEGVCCRLRRHGWQHTTINSPRDMSCKTAEKRGGFWRWREVPYGCANVPQESNFPFPHRHTNGVIIITLVIKIKHGSQMLCSYGRVISQ